MPKPLELFRFTISSTPQERFEECFDKINTQRGSLHDDHGQIITMTSATAQNKNHIDAYPALSGKDLMDYCLEEFAKLGYTLKDSISSSSGTHATSSNSDHVPSTDSVTIPSSVIISMLDNQNNNANNSSNTQEIQNNAEQDLNTGEAHYYVQDWS